MTELCRLTAIICGGTPIQVSTCHMRARSTVTYVCWRSMKHMKKDTPAFRPSFCSLRTTNIYRSLKIHPNIAPLPRRFRARESILFEGHRYGTAATPGNTGAPIGRCRRCLPNHGSESPPSLGGGFSSNESCKKSRIDPKTICRSTELFSRCTLSSLSMNGQGGDIFP